MKYPLTFYQGFAVPKGSEARARGPVILIRPKYKDDNGIYAHEWVHIKQSFMGLIVLHATEHLRITSDGMVSLSTPTPKIYQTTAADRLCLTGANDGVVSSGDNSTAG